MSERETFGVCHMCGAVPEETCRMMDSMGPCVRPPVSRATGGERAGLVERITAYLTGGGLFNPELANHEAVRDLLIACRDALSSAPAPEERHRRFAEAVNARISYDVQDSTVYVEFKSPRDAVAFEEAMRGCDRHPDPDFRPVLASPPSGAGSPVADNRAIVPLLTGHWLTAVECDHATNTDKACCWCGWASDSLPTVGDAVCAWAEHVASFAAPPAAGREPSEADYPRVEVVSLRDDNNKGTLSGIIDDDGDAHLTIQADGRMQSVEFCTMRGGGRNPEFTAIVRRFIYDISRAALGASAQTNTGEGR